LPAVFTALAGAATAILASYLAHRSAERRDDRAREEAQYQQQMRELRALTDDAAKAMRDMWGILGTFATSIPRGNPPVARRSPIETREPDAADFVATYERLLDANVRLLMRVDWNDTLHSPVGQALVRAQEAYNAVIHEDPLAPRSKRSEQLILRALSAAHTGYRELQGTARQRFAPRGLPRSERTTVLVLDVVRPGETTDGLLAELRRQPGRGSKVAGPDTAGRVVVRDSEPFPGEAHQRLVQSLDDIQSDWASYLKLRHPAAAEPDAP
jgi:hypothetical protein